MIIILLAIVNIKIIKKQYENVNSIYQTLTTISANHFHIVFILTLTIVIVF